MTNPLAFSKVVNTYNKKMEIVNT